MDMFRILVIIMLTITTCLTILKLLKKIKRSWTEIIISDACAVSFLILAIVKN